jgi:hypothetical protein
MRAVEAALLSSRSKRAAEPVALAESQAEWGLRFWRALGSDEVSHGASCAVATVSYHFLPGMLGGGEIMRAPVPEYSMHIYEMMARLGIEPGAGVLPQLSLRYATALHRCEHCRSKKACQDWLDYAPAMVNFAPDFCGNADILFELQYDQPWSRRVN